MSTFSLTPLEFNPSSPRVVSYMNLMVLVQKTRCDIHGKPLWRRRLETTVKYWIRQRLLWRSVHWAVDKALGFRITFKMVQVYQICNHTAFYFSWQCTPFVCPTERTMKIWTLCALVNLLFTVRHWGNSLSCTKSHVPRIEHDKKGAFVICELSKRIDVLLFPLILSKDSEGWKCDRKSEDPIDTHKLRLFVKYAAKLWLFAPNPFLPTKWWEIEFAQRVVRLSIYKFSSWNKR